MRPVFFNGKFYTAGLNGVHRVADRLIRQVDEILGDLPSSQRPLSTLVVPNGGDWAPALQHILVERDARRGGQIWEQTALPLRARGGVLVNLCNLAPVAHPRKLMMIHDAQFLFPDSSYPARQRWGYTLLAPLMARTSRHVWTVSSYSRQMLDLFGVSSSRRTSVVYNGIDHLGDRPPAAPAGMPAGRFVVMFGSPKRYKNCEVAFRAFERPELEGLTLALVGPGREELERAGLKPPMGVAFLGRLSDEELRFVLGSAECLLCPSRTEGFGLPPLEAMAAGCPTVISPAGALPEVCGDAAAYAGVDADDEWAHAILRYVRDPVWRAMKVEAGLTRASAFTWSQAGDLLFEDIWAAAHA